MNNHRKRHFDEKYYFASGFGTKDLVWLFLAIFQSGNKPANSLLILQQKEKSWFSFWIAADWVSITGNQDLIVKLGDEKIRLLLRNWIFMLIWLAGRCHQVSSGAKSGSDRWIVHPGTSFYYVLFIKRKGDWVFDSTGHLSLKISTGKSFVRSFDVNETIVV